MKITKETFICMLDILENDDFINYSINNSENSIEVINIEDGSWKAYKIDSNNYLIDPQIEKLEQKIANLENEKKELEKKLQILKNR